MHLYACTSDKQIVFAGQAVKQRDYLCLECGGSVRLRKGQHRHVHFYHLAPPENCRQNGKSMEHLQVQWSLFRKLPGGEAVLEKRMPEINRIGDVVWEAQKLVFEIQCSPISPEEITQRNRDYASLGYQVIWILHDKRFNQWRQTAAENALRTRPYYYTNITVEGTGVIYDQIDQIHKGVRKKLDFPALVLSSYVPIPLPEASCFPFRPDEPILARMQQWPFYFEGDFSHFLLKNPELFQEIFKPAPVLKTSWSQLISRWFQCFIVRPYYLTFQVFLEKLCK